ncbi:hypothetical protein Tco_0675427 [Tanacetum coccineum]
MKLEGSGGVEKIEGSGECEVEGAGEVSGWKSVKIDQEGEVKAAAILQRTLLQAVFFRLSNEEYCESETSIEEKRNRSNDRLYRPTIDSFRKEPSVIDSE